MPKLFLSEKVATALQERTPIVALESTILAHGFSHPENFQLGKELEGLVEQHGATPATIAILDGNVHVGLDRQHLARITSPRASIEKCNIADIAVFSATGKNAATTVSATAAIAHAAGIRVFATGGIGGVHQGSHFDVSADLYALAQLPIAVIASGAKSILDLPRTLEVMESLGVLTLGYKTFDFPSFYSRSSGHRLEHSIPDLATLAKILKIRWSELRQGAVLVCNPIPPEDEIPRDQVNQWIQDAEEAAYKEQIQGKAKTPFLLRKIAELSEGRSVKANRALVRSNVIVATGLASQLASDGAI